jgi:hypothetical protein
MFCPITAVNVDGLKPSVGYYALDFTANGAIHVTVKRMQKTAAAPVTDVCSLPTSVDSASGQFQSIAGTTCFTTAMDTDAYIYFIVVDILKSATGGALSFRGIELF